ncbi:Uncharacterised protein [Mycobacteroides abscessus subsp. abscessus]|nr:Uncharacterised protein [Mycobacteroides abscessus subsp. abscessus]SHY16130.1 Uncharacterised protein [Mycobacteroides abscessus subsp. abscessus]SIB55298.1 Uncharacterised protein [Mycobacteroides abscessus subsp. abscessus]SIB94831.1 Uncharacterised protein [Mycobacteroides abscessus subsp. abscessus]SIC80599.1 Uncharacterised protein [Mycobacteroides abscessus subsp. abscessus]
MSISPCLFVSVNSKDRCIEVTVHLGAAADTAICPHHVDPPYSAGGDQSCTPSDSGVAASGLAVSGERRCSVTPTAPAARRRDSGAGGEFVVEMDWEEVSGDAW